MTKTIELSESDARIIVRALAMLYVDLCTQGRAGEAIEIDELGRRLSEELGE